MVSVKVSLVAFLLFQAMLVLVLNLAVCAYEDEIAPSPGMPMTATGSALASPSSASVVITKHIGFKDLLNVNGEQKATKFCIKTSITGDARIMYEFQAARPNCNTQKNNNSAKPINLLHHIYKNFSGLIDQS
ncbi:hypothetical protein QYF36_002642 [Acer negundo]|nr:hypothetical protein QYF36_002642 [Acer negundo]